MDIQQSLAKLSSTVTELCGYKVEIHTAPAADSLFVCADTGVEALQAVGKVAKLLKWTFVEILEDGPDDWGYYYRVVQAGQATDSSSAEMAPSDNLAVPI